MQSFPISSGQVGLIENISISKIRNLSINGIEITLRQINLNLDKEMELADSIRQYGLLIPIIVRTTNYDYFEIISGYRRLKAFENLGLRKILCHVVTADDQRAIDIFLIDNLHTKKINPIEEAILFKRYTQDFGWGGVTDLSKRISKSISYIDRRIRLLDLDKDLQDDIASGRLNTSIAEELLTVKNKNALSELSEIIRNRLPALREFRQIVKEKKVEIIEYTERLEHIDSNITDMMMIDKKTQRSFDQAIIGIRMSMDKLSDIINNNEDNWIVYEIMMYHKRVLHEQIDLLYKEKRKLRH